MKISKVLLWLTGGFLVLCALGAWSTYDYNLNCMKCLASKYVLEQRFCDIPIWHRAKDRKTAIDYERIYGRPCDHVFRQGGFGRTAYLFFVPVVQSCGEVPIGSFVRPRREAIAATFDANTRLQSSALALETLQFIDSQMQPDLSLHDLEDRKIRTRAEASGWTLRTLNTYLRRAKATDEWSMILEAARGGFTDTRKLPRR